MKLINKAKIGLCAMLCIGMLTACSDSANVGAGTNSKDALQFIEQNGDTVIYYDKATGVEYIGLERNINTREGTASLSVRLDCDGKPVIHK